ncbi:GYDIA family GHMP kinase [Flavobacterium sp.]|jgi:mevalonate kinase|uniref:GYDIA family GHMP kinase n=1 Tax=Flavobacterium sp. TaxID=239 RepID=UPI0022C24F46|nr:GYDIA family GHMP kinase [Flavobacterium sp.]MCZ8230480.1 GYDIA family GHMP kinase [Flavobacterium sp.]
MKQTFYSNGKLLLTGEYLVLDGANALALPTKMGQNLQVVAQDKPTISWKSFDADGSIWFEDELELEAIINHKESADSSIKNTLLTILHHAQLLQPNAFQKTTGYKIETTLTFPKKWGLGTSSTLINNLAQWLKIDAFELLNNSFGGSGYDIACAQHNTPIFYRLENQKPIVTPVRFQPEFASNLYFVYLNQKQNSKTAIAAYYNNKNQNLQENIAAINKLTNTVVNAKSIHAFANALQLHENEMSTILELLTVQEALFPDFDGVIKSLGAWGGDFVLAIAIDDPTAYFTEKGYTTIIPYQEMILGA